MAPTLANVPDRVLSPEEPGYLKDKRAHPEKYLYTERPDVAPVPAVAPTRRHPGALHAREEGEEDAQGFISRCEASLAAAEAAETPFDSGSAAFRAEEGAAGGREGSFVEAAFRAKPPGVGRHRCCHVRVCHHDERCVRSDAGKEGSERNE